jgi:chitinase
MDGSSESSGSNGVSSNGYQPTVSPNQTTPTPSSSGTGGVVLSVGSRTPQVTPTPTPQATPTPHITLTLQVTPTPHIVPTIQATLTPRVTLTPQVTPMQHIAPIVQMTPTPRVTLTPQVTPMQHIAPIVQMTPTPHVTLTPQIIQKPRIVPIVKVTPTPHITLTPQVTPTLVPPNSQTVVVPPTTVQRNVAYFTQSGVDNHNYTVKDIDASGAASKLTAINYAFAGISSDLKCQSVNPQADYHKHFTDTVSGEPDGWNAPLALAGNFNQLKELKAKYPNLKILISIGGWRLSGQFSNAADPQNIQSFVQSCIDMFIKGDMPGLAPGAAAGIFDGIDIDWQYPAFSRTDDQSKGGYTFDPNDTQNYTALLAEFRKQLGNKYLLTIAAPASQDKFSKIQLNEIGQYVNWINLMSFNYHGNSQTQTDRQMPIYCNPNDPSSAKTYCIDYSVTSYRKAGIPAAKINLGLLFSEDVSTNGAKNKKRLYQNQEIIDRVNYARSKGLGGVFCWPLDEDDSQGTLLKAMTGSNGT